MLRSCKQMERLVRDFGDLSEIESDAVVLRPGIHDGAEVLALACEGARANAAERGVEIAVERPPEAVLLRCDRDRILRALAHVIENAVRFAPKETAVALQVREQAGEVRFSVTDCGPGLDAETLQHLYDRQWHGKRADRVGAGLGLAIARGFILAHGGRIDVQSEPGATTFVLAVPKDAPSVPDLARAR
jgi:signal transduction histidine kinase